MLWIAHRGESLDAPENTMRAFRLAWERDTDGIELDIRLTADKQIVCIHDADTARIGDRLLDVAETPYGILREIDAGRGERIPLLLEVLAEAPVDRLIYIEVKSGPEILQPLKEVVEKSAFPFDKLRIIDFNSDNLKKCGKLLPNVKRYLLSGIKVSENGTLSPSAVDLRASQLESGVDGFDLFACKKIKHKFLAGLKTEIAVWTIDDLKLAEKFMTLGVDAITSNRAAYLKSKLED
ncbi:MAG: glycerophosphodiester phosphodiesterase family protein [Victivallaceae bacterium]|jgi:glycerophosphoryl diester phosphodiesterase